MAADHNFRKCLDAAQVALRDGESLIRIRRAEPLPMSHADYFTLFKVEVGKLSPAADEVSDIRCLIVKISSNSGNAAIDATASCTSIPELRGL
jgi:hypothetical protein